MTEQAPGVTLRHGGGRITVVVEQPAWPRTRDDGSQYVAAELTIDQARSLRDDLDRRITELRT